MILVFTGKIRKHVQIHEFEQYGVRIKIARLSTSFPRSSPSRPRLLGDEKESTLGTRLRTCYIANLNNRKQLLIGKN